MQFLAPTEIGQQQEERALTFRDMREYVRMIAASIAHYQRAWLSNELEFAAEKSKEAGRTHYSRSLKDVQEHLTRTCFPEVRSWRCSMSCRSRTRSASVKERGPRCGPTRREFCLGLRRSRTWTVRPSRPSSIWRTVTRLYQPPGTTDWHHVSWFSMKQERPMQSDWVKVSDGKVESNCAEAKKAGWWKYSNVFRLADGSAARVGFTQTWDKHTLWIRRPRWQVLDQEYQKRLHPGNQTPPSDKGVHDDLKKAQAAHEQQVNIADSALVRIQPGRHENERPRALPETREPDREEAQAGSPAGVIPKSQTNPDSSSRW